MKCKYWKRQGSRLVTNWLGLGYSGGAAAQSSRSVTGYSPAPRTNDLILLGPPGLEEPDSRTSALAAARQATKRASQHHVRAGIHHPPGLGTLSVGPGRRRRGSQLRSTGEQTTPGSHSGDAWPSADHYRWDNRRV